MEKEQKNIYKNRWIILFILVLEPFMACLDSSIVNVALPVMSQKLSVTMASIEWVVTGYLIAVVSTIMVFGKLGDIKSKVNVFKFGLIVFTIGSFMCGISKTLMFLLISRAIQGVGAAASMGTSQGIITQVFPANERGRALGICGTFVALGAMIGPPLGGIIVSYFSWHYIFLINVPIGLIIIPLSMKLLPKSSKVVSNEKLDTLGSVLFALFIVLLFGAMIEGQNIGYNKVSIITCFVLSLIFFILFVITEKKVENPTVDLSIFDNKMFTVSIICAFIVFSVISCSNIIIPFYLQYALKLSPSITGFIMIISPLILAIVAPLSGYLSDKLGSEKLTFYGLILVTAGLVLMSTLNEHSAVVYLVIFLGIITLGNGMFQSPNTSLIMSLVPKNKLGIAGSINALVRNVGFVFGISFSTTLLYNRMSYKVGYHVNNYIKGRDDVFIYGMRYVYIAAAVLCIIGAVITAMRLFRKHEA